MSNSICFFPGKFSPPTKFNLNTALYLERREEIHNVIIVVGKDTGTIPQETIYRLWRLLLGAQTVGNITIELAAGKSSLNYIYDKLMKNPDADCFIAMDETSARKEQFGKYFNKFPNQKIELIPSQFNDSSKQMLKAIAEDNLPVIKSLLPEDMSKEKFDEYISLLQPEPVEESSEELKERVLAEFNKDFWLNVFSLNEAKNEFENLKKNKVPLTPEEREQCLKAKAVWHHGPGGAESSAVWKSKDKKTGKITYITHTHRAWNKAATLQACINKYHNFIKGTS